MIAQPYSRISVEGIRDVEEAHRPTSGINVGQAERWASAVAGGLLVAQGLRKGTFGGLSLALLGGALAYRGISGHCAAYEMLHIDTSDKSRSDESESVHKGVLVKESRTINRPAAELYAYWRDFTKAPRYMNHVESVQVLDDARSHWVIKGPFGTTLEWDSTIINEEPGRLIAWKSDPGGDINHAGTIRFDDPVGGRGTVVTLEMNYEPPAGIVGITIARLMGDDPQQLARESLRRFQNLMEAGEIPTISGQTSGRAKV